MKFQFDLEQDGLSTEASAWNEVCRILERAGIGIQPYVSPNDKLDALYEISVLRDAYTEKVTKESK